MKARAQYRSLFTTTSFAALLATTSGAMAGTSYTSPNTNEIYNSGGMTDYIEVLTTLENDDGIDGLVVTGSNNGAYSVINMPSGIINVSDDGLGEEGLDEYDGSLNGIYIVDGALVSSQLSNAGAITVQAGLTAEVTSAESSLYRDAAGMRVDTGGTAGEIANSGTMSVSAFAGLGFDSGDPKYQYVQTEASAYGVDFFGLHTSFENSGSIDVTSHAGSFASTNYGEEQFLEDTEEDTAPGETFAQAEVQSKAVGAHFLNPDDAFGTLVSDVYNSSTGQIHATATGTGAADVSLDVQCSISSEEGCEAPNEATGEAIVHADVRGYGIEIGINTAEFDGEDNADETLLANSGGFDNYGSITGAARGLIASGSSVITSGSDAQAGAGIGEFMYEDGSTLVARGIGVAYGVNKFDGDFYNDGDIEGHVAAQATSHAVASANDYAEAGAYADVDAKAKGVELHAMLLQGGFENSGRIEAGYDLLIGTLEEGEDEDPNYYVPMSATARGGEEANAWTNVRVNASATGIEIQGSSMTDDFVLSDRTDEDSGVFATGDYHAELAALATTTASGSPSEEAEASARVSGSHNADVAGVEFYVTNLSGQFINNGLVVADNDLFVSHNAQANSVDNGYAGVDADISSRATGIHIESQEDEDGAVISGNFYNTGQIESHAESVFEGNATNEGIGQLRAEANSEMSTTATGLEIELGELQDNFTSDGDISVSAYARRELSAQALAARDGEDGTFADAEAYAGNTSDLENEGYVSTSATGIDLYADQIGGHIFTDGEISVNGASEDWVTAHAQAGDQGNAYAYAQSSTWANGTGVYVETSGVGTALQYVEDVDVLDGYIVNEGDIEVNINGWSALSAEANAVDGSAIAHAQISGSSDGNIYAYGLLYEGSDGQADIAGSVVNTGQINVRAGLYAQVDANAYVGAGDSEEGVAVATAGGTNGVYAAGLVVRDFDIASTEFFGFGEDFAGFMNYGDINVEADAQQSTTAHATSNDGPAAAIIGTDITSDGPLNIRAQDANYLVAYGTGIALDDVSIDNGFVNWGNVSFAANVENNNYAKADGGTYALAEVDAGSFAHGIGMQTENLVLDDQFVNTGMLYGEANAASSNEAEADGDDATARIKHYNGDTDVAIQTTATATGLALNADASFDFYNGNDGEDFSGGNLSNLFWSSQGLIAGYASAVSHDFANADASQDDAEAIVMQNDYAHASGMVLTQDDGGSVDFYNQGAIAGLAFAGNGIGASEDYLGYTPDNADTEDGGRQRAYAIADEGDADAHVTYVAAADAVGVNLEVSDFGNDGWIAALAVAGGSAYAHAISLNGEDTADATADVAVYVNATGAHLYGTYYSGFENSGLISAIASASAYAEAEAEGSEDLNADATAQASAHAYGAVIDSDGSYNTITNTEGGTISAHAEAWAWERSIYEGGENDGEMGSSNASAYGFIVNAPFNTLENDGVITASASASEEARAVGLNLNGASDYSFSGVVVNNGTISAFASAEDPYATGILVSEDGRYTSIENFGTISATVEDTSDIEPFSAPEYSSAIAIDIRDSEDGMQVSQRAGAIIGDIVMANGNLDHFDWSGGTIDGDIYGDYEQDVINVYASTIDETTYNAFVYDGVVDGADSFSVNGGEHGDAVSLRLTNQVRNVASFNVGPNATVNLGTNASVQTDALNLNASSTLVFDINDTAEPANGVINTSTAALAGTVKAQFISPWNRTTDHYRIINWQEESDTTFDHVVSSDVLTKVTAQYGEDGVDLVMQFLDFGDLTYLEDDATSLGLALDKTWDEIDPNSPIGLALQDLLQLTPDQFAYELAQIAGQQTADVQNVTVAQLGSLIHVIQTQINESRTLAGDTNSGDGLSFSVGSDKMKFSSKDDFKPLAGASAGDPVMNGDWRAWARVFGDWAELKASNTAPGFKSDAAGVVIGADYAPSDGLTIGLAGGYQTSDMKFGGVGKGDIDSWSATAYMDYEFGNAYVDGLVGYAAQSYDMDRYLTVLGTDYTANAKYDGGATIAAIEAGYKVALGNTLTLTPFVGLNTTYTTTDGSTETGAGVWNISYDDRSDTQVDSVLGARLSKDFKTDGGILLTPTIELGWKHGYGDTSPTAGASMAGIPGSQYTIFGSETKPDTAIVGAALQAQLTDTVDAYVQYNGQYSGDYSDNTASLRLRLKF